MSESIERMKKVRENTERIRQEQDAAGPKHVPEFGQDEDGLVKYITTNVAESKPLTRETLDKAAQQMSSQGGYHHPPNYPDSHEPEGDSTVTSLMHDRAEQQQKVDWMAETLPTDAQARKDIPLVTGLLDYFPAALAEIAKVSKAGNDKHNPGEPLHWAREKSTDQADCIGRHLLERGGIDPETGQRHTAQMAWRALALLQLELEAAGAPKARAAK